MSRYASIVQDLFFAFISTYPTDKELCDYEDVLAYDDGLTSSEYCEIMRNAKTFYNELFGGF